MAKRKSAMQTSGKRNIVAVPLLAPADHAVNMWCDKTGSSKAKMLQKLVEWFAAAPESLQQIIVGTVPKEMREVFIKSGTTYFDYFRVNGKWPMLGDWSEQAIEELKAQLTQLMGMNLSDHQVQELNGLMRRAEDSLKHQELVSETGHAANQAVEMEREQPRRAPKKSA